MTICEICGSKTHNVFCPFCNDEVTDIPSKVFLLYGNTETLLFGLHLKYIRFKEVVFIYDNDESINSLLSSFGFETIRYDSDIHIFETILKSKDSCFFIHGYIKTLDSCYIGVELLKKGFPVFYFNTHIIDYLKPKDIPFFVKGFFLKLKYCLMGVPLVFGGFDFKPTVLIDVERLFKKYDIKEYSYHAWSNVDIYAHAIEYFNSDYKCFKSYDKLLVGTPVLSSIDMRSLTGVFNILVDRQGFKYKYHPRDIGNICGIDDGFNPIEFYFKNMNKDGVVVGLYSASLFISNAMNIKTISLIDMVQWKNFEFYKIIKKIFNDTNVLMPSSIAELEGMLNA